MTKKTTMAELGRRVERGLERLEAALFVLTPARVVALLGATAVLLFGLGGVRLGPWQYLEAVYLGVLFYMGRAIYHCWARGRLLGVLGLGAAWLFLLWLMYGTFREQHPPLYVAHLAGAFAAVMVAMTIGRRADHREP